MRRFVLGWKKLGLEQTPSALGSSPMPIDLVILCRRGNAETALHHLREIMGKLKLTVNERRHASARFGGEFDFLGFTFGRMHSPMTGQARMALRPSKRSIKRMVERSMR